MGTTRISLALIVCLLLGLGTSCQENKIDQKAEGEALMELSREWSKAAESRDIEKILAYWDDNALIISAGEPEIKGKQSIREMVEGSFQDSSFSISWEPESVEISASGDMGYLLEKSTLSFMDSMGNANTQTFRSVTIWKKQADGSWKNVVDIMSPIF
jgi:ketosteroid isomerase-like protein